MPNAPDRPVSFPECRSTRKIRITAISTCTTPRSVSTAGECSRQFSVLSSQFPVASRRRRVLTTANCELGTGSSFLPAERVELLQYPDRLAAQLRVVPPPILLRELARLAVHLRVADLPVLRLLARLEVGEPRVLICSAILPAGAAQRRGHEDGDHQQDHGYEQELQHTGKARGVSRRFPVGRVRPATAPGRGGRRTRRRPCAGAPRRAATARSPRRPARSATRSRSSSRAG